MIARAHRHFAFAAVLLMTVSSGCATLSPSAHGRGLLRLNVEPNDALVFVDGDYMGQTNGWTEQTIPLASGPRRVEIRAQGYFAQRFDIEIRPNEEVTLNLALEPEFADYASQEVEH